MSDYYKNRFAKRTFFVKYVRTWGVPLLASRLRSLHISRSIRRLKPTAILDVGCGPGCHFLELKKEFPVSTIYCCDIDESNLVFATNISRALGDESVKFFKKDLLELRDRRKWDLIICSDILEHIEDDKKAISKIVQALNEHGMLCIHVPKRLDSARRFKRGHDLYDHAREGYTIQEVRYLLERDFTIHSIRETFSVVVCVLTRGYQILLKYFFPWALLAFPVFSFLVRLDLFFTRNGRCLVVLAEKKGKTMVRAEE